MKKFIAILVGIGLSLSAVAFAADTANQSNNQSTDKGTTHQCCDCAKHKHKHHS